MKKTSSLLITALVLICHANAQLVTGKSKVTGNDWYNLSFDKDNVYGAEVNKAYDYLKGKTIKKRPVVAIIGTGLDIDNKLLANAIWTNPDEIANDGIDNDKNGWVDDIHGWNFLGNAKGEMIEETPTEGDREFLRLRDKYEGVFFDGTTHVKYDGLLKKMVPVTWPIDTVELSYFKLLTTLSSLAKASSMYYSGQMVQYYFITDIDPALQKKFGNDSLITPKSLAAIYDPARKDKEPLWYISLQLVNIGLTYKIGTRTTTYSEFKRSITATKYVGDSKKQYDKLLARTLALEKENSNNWKDISARNYGNGILYVSSSGPGTMGAGIIAANRNGGGEIKGIADAVLMPLRVYPAKGDAYIKDIALAIRYAVDKQADIIHIQRLGILNPGYQAKWLSDAMAYAQEKGVLVIAPAWESYADLANKEYYPNRHILNNGKDLDNFMIVGGSDSTGKPTTRTDYGKKELDVFAPGEKILATSIGDTYRLGSGAFIPSSVVVGVAALIKSYYPTLTAPQIRKLIIDNVTSRKGVEVEKLIAVTNKKAPVTELFLFEDLCISGGIVNAYKTIVAAEKLSVQNK